MDHTEFKFSMGEKVLIGELNSHVKQIIEKDGLKYFSLKTKDGKKRKFRNEGTVLIPSVGRFFTNFATEQCAVRNQFDLRKDLYEKLLNFLKRKGVNGEKLNEMNMDDLSISVNDDQSISGQIMCVLCDRGDNKKFCVNTIRGEKHRIYWIFSNFDKHLVKKHQMKSDKKETVKEPERKQNIKKRKHADSKDLLKSDENTNLCAESEIRDVRSAEFLQEDSHYIITEEKKEEAANESTCIELAIEALSNDEGLTLDCIETCIYDQISKQTLKMTEIYLQNNEKDETVKFIHLDQTFWADVISIPPDGDCLFAAIAHQLFGNKIDTEDFKCAVIQLRIDTCNYIKNNLSSFKHELKERIYAIKDTETRAKEKIKIDFEKEFEEFLSNHLSKNGFWGGSESIKAISLMHKTNILLINEGGMISFANGFERDFKTTVIVAYRLNKFFRSVISSGGIRNHYDSVVNIETDSILKISEMMATHEMNQQSLDAVIVCLSD